MSDNWRVQISKVGPGSPDLEEIVAQCERSLPDLDVNRIEGGVVIYAPNEEAAREAAEVADDVVASLGFSAAVEIARWDTYADKWKDPAEPPSPPLVPSDVERISSAEARFEVRLNLPPGETSSHIWDELGQEGFGTYSWGFDTIRRYKFAVPARTVEDAMSLYEGLRSALPMGGTITFVELSHVQRWLRRNVERRVYPPARSDIES